MLFAMQFARSDGFNSIPSATGGIARLACARLDEMGKDPTVILSKVGLTPEEARDPAIRLEVRTQIKLLELAAEEVQDEWLGFHLARSFDLREIGLVYYVMASSEQLADALRNAERYSQINNEGVRLRFSMQDGSAVIALDYVNVDRHADRHQIEFWLVTLVRICRQVTNGRLSPLRLKTRHFRNGMPAEFRTFFGVDIEFGANADEIWFPRPIALLPVVGRDEYLNELLRRYAEEALARKPRDHRECNKTDRHNNSLLCPSRPAVRLRRYSAYLAATHTLFKADRFSDASRATLGRGLAVMKLWPIGIVGDLDQPNPPRHDRIEARANRRRKGCARCARTRVLYAPLRST